MSNQHPSGRIRPARSEQNRVAPARIQPARRVAYEVITAVRRDDAYANLLLPVKLERARLGAQDAALATELTYGTLRQQGYYDAVIELAAKRPTSEIDEAILDVLRLGVHQLLSMRVAAHAAVDESVSLAREVGSRSATGFVNGVLRTITRSEPDEWRARVMAAPRTDDERLSLEFSHPVWIVRAFRQALAAEGREEELEALLEADNFAPKVSLVALPGIAKVSEIRGERASKYSPVAGVSDGGDPALLPAVHEGRARVQDEGSQLAALALSRARPIEPGERWLDLCAGPGGKAVLLAAEAALGGVTLVANEITPARAQLVRNALKVLPEPPQVLVQDGRELGEQLAGQFDRILLDAPCTGLGALRRRPEARWRKQPKDVPDLSALQTQLLEAGLTALKPGGILAYVTCSPHLAETRAVVGSVLKNRTDVRRLDAVEVLSGVTKTPLPLGDGDDGHVQLWPHRHGTDAMFIALLQRDE
ncbi:rRNA small subunit methyltransferase B [Lacisediminihabitans sp. G11-30]|uniref:rRNA small subunit methyltransferase B n=1 Tax=Lacisediminihabitans changchengi TaxID=2787634 RepID=A0A934SK65_9MICO|nr:rRNA small subunit methyltransferase B [Lacisediminihabitans changchengi]MBK4348081.1 rRNA small subunit methyltransferase B [Lacisediminihabitans changchengi]